MLLYARIVRVCVYDVRVRVFWRKNQAGLCVGCHHRVKWQLARNEIKNKTKPLYGFCFYLLRNFAGHTASAHVRVWENRRKKTSTIAPVYVFHVWFRQIIIIIITQCCLKYITCALYVINSIRSCEERNRWVWSDILRLSSLSVLYEL